MLNGTYKWDVALAGLPISNYQFYIAARDIVGAGSNIAVNPVQNTTFAGFSSADPVNYTSNPDASANIRTFRKLTTLAGGTYFVGPSGSYQKLTDVANLLGAATVTGNVIFELEPGYDGTTGETFPITFNEFTTSGGNWTVTITASTNANGLQITGSATVLIDLNGVKRLTLSGGVNKQLTINNTSTTGIAVRFINNAQNNNLQYINIKNNNTVEASGAIVFGTAAGTTAASGNSNNTIDHCDIDGLSASATGIYALGSAAPADNKNNTITNCNIFDFFATGADSVTGVYLRAGNSGWNIGTAGNGNNFYQTAIRNSTTTPAITTAKGFRAIAINDASVSGCSIVNNRIGGNIPGIFNSVFEIGDNAGGATAAYLASYFIAVDIIKAATSNATTIQGNIISDIIVYSSANPGFSAIQVLGGLANITGNTIGSSTSNNAIKLFYKNTASANFYGIRNNNNGGGGLVQNNSIGSITLEALCPAGTSGLQLMVIYLGASTALTSPVSISNNLIGSYTTAHSIQNAVTSNIGANVMGIVISAALGMPVQVVNNTIANISTLCATSSDNRNAVKGIYLVNGVTLDINISGNTIAQLYSASRNGASNENAAVIGISTVANGAGGQFISNNTISGLVSGADTATTIMGIYYAGASTGANVINKNLFHSLYANASTSTAANVSAIKYAGTGTTKLVMSNNMISLGLDSFGTAVGSPNAFTGIYKTTATAATVFNTVNISGYTFTPGTLGTYAYNSTATGTDSLFNNIFINSRYNTGGGASHYAIGLDNATNLKTNYNLYNATVLGQFNGVDKASLTDWQTATTQDANSVNTTATFLTFKDLHLTGSSLGDMALKGIPLTGYTTDFDGQTRTITPYMGADETTPALPVQLTNFAAKQLKNNALVYWTTASESNASHFGIERSMDGKNFEPVANIKAVGNSTKVNNYNYTDAGVLSHNNAVYYRLKMVDNDGSFKYTKTVLLSKNKSANELQLAVFPNPTNSDINIIFDAQTAALTLIDIKDITGKTLESFMHQTVVGVNTPSINLENLKAGVYFVSININGQVQTTKVMKQ